MIARHSRDGDIVHWCCKCAPKPGAHHMRLHLQSAICTCMCEDGCMMPACPCTHLTTRSPHRQQQPAPPQRSLHAKEIHQARPGAAAAMHTPRRRPPRHTQQRRRRLGRTPVRGGVCEARCVEKLHWRSRAFAANGQVTVWHVSEQARCMGDAPAARFSCTPACRHPNPVAGRGRGRWPGAWTARGRAARRPPSARTVRTLAERCCMRQASTGAWSSASSIIPPPAASGTPAAAAAATAAAPHSAHDAPVLHTSRQAQACGQPCKACMGS